MSSIKSKIHNLLLSKDYTIEEYDGGDTYEKSIKKLSHGSQMCFTRCSILYNKTSGSRDARIESLLLSLLSDYDNNSNAVIQSIKLILHEIHNHNIQHKINPNLLTAITNVPLILEQLNNPTKPNTITSFIDESNKQLKTNTNNRPNKISKINSTNKSFSVPYMNNKNIDDKNSTHTPDKSKLSNKSSNNYTHINNQSTTTNYKPRNNDTNYSTNKLTNDIDTYSSEYDSDIQTADINENEIPYNLDIDHHTILKLKQRIFKWKNNNPNEHYDNVPRKLIIDNIKIIQMGGN